MITTQSIKATQTNFQQETSVISIRNVSKKYVLGDEKVYALRDVSLEVQPGEFVTIIGPSGSGKSTLMNIIGCLDRPTGGQYELVGQQVSQMNRGQLAKIRNQYIGFIFQGYNLLTRETALSRSERHV